jgi:hypothetical protein
MNNLLPLANATQDHHTRTKEHFMKRILTVSLFAVLSSISVWAAKQDLTGEISDGMCGASHTGMGDVGKNARECTAACVKAGAKYVLVSKGTVYAIQNQDFGALASNAGVNVRVTGDVGKDGKSITLSKISRTGK